MSPTDSILLFDGVCNLCNRVVNFVIRNDKNERIKFAPIQSTAAQSLLKEMFVNQDDIDSVVYLTGGKAFIKSSAVLHLLKDIGRVWKVFYVFIIIPAFIRDSFYNLIANTRYRFFGKSDYCMIPSEKIKGRFLS